MYVTMIVDSARLDRLKHVAEEWRLRVHLMEGKNIDQLDDIELKRLNMLQQIGYDRVKNVLSISTAKKTPQSPTAKSTSDPVADIESSAQ